jgi:hypothetical protein
MPYVTRYVVLPADANTDQNFCPGIVQTLKPNPVFQPGRLSPLSNASIQGANTTYAER